MSKGKKSGAPKTERRHRADGPRTDTKTHEVSRLLQRKNGATRAEILEATGWPTVSVQALAKNCGLELSQEKEKGSTTRYFGRKTDQVAA